MTTHSCVEPDTNYVGSYPGLYIDDIPQYKYHYVTIPNGCHNVTVVASSYQ